MTMSFRLIRGNGTIVVGLTAICLIFQTLNPNFLSARNLTNLLLQISAPSIISLGIVLVLLIGEIDLSAGAVSGLCGGITAALTVKAQFPFVFGLTAGVGCGAVIGLLQGFLIVRVGVPSFIVTLAGLLVWQGALLQVLGDTGTVNLSDRYMIGMANTFLTPAVGWISALAGIAVILYRLIRRARTGLRRSGVARRSQDIAQNGIVIGAIAAMITVVNFDRGLPLSFVLAVGLFFGFDLLTKYTQLGRYMFAIGGNVESARRVGIRVTDVRMAVFVFASTAFAFGGILASARLLAVNQTSGSGDILLNAIAAAVIGGTSLTGGRGNVWSALSGMVIIGSISNGMDLLALRSSLKYMAEGGILLVAITIDSRRRNKSGNAY
jgi:D-xylose transport system permease protein